MKIRLTKLKELPDAEHPNNIEEGFEKIGEFIGKPEVGEAFWLGMNWRTSPVTELLEDNTFKTLNSI